MSVAASVSSTQALDSVLPHQKSTPTVVVVAGVNRSSIVDAALADPALAIAAGARLEPACAPPCHALLWRCETAAGTPLNDPDVLARHWQRAPYALTVRLVQYQPGRGTPEILDEATLGTLGSKATFRAALDRLAMRLVRDAAMGRSRGLSGASPAAAPTGMPGWLHYQRARWQARASVEWWSVGTTSVSVDALLTGGGLGRVAWFREAAGERYLADPFPWPGTDRILCEDMPIHDGIGRIVALTLRSGDLEAGPVLLDDGAHHSYPCAVVDGNATFCVPEAPERGKTRIYRLAADGSLTPVVDPAPHLRLADPTLFTFDGLFWLACTDLDVGTHDNLCLLHAPAITGPWQPHARWPVKIDIRSSRPAGTVLQHDGKLYRPAQDCAATYGAAVVIHEVRRLTPFDYAERVVTVLRPDRHGPFPDGLHTLTHDGTRFWIDGKRFVFSPGIAGRKLMNKVIRRTAAAKVG